MHQKLRYPSHTLPNAINHNIDNPTAFSPLGATVAGSTSPQNPSFRPSIRKRRGGSYSRRSAKSSSEFIENEKQSLAAIVNGAAVSSTLSSFLGARDDVVIYSWTVTVSNWNRNKGERDIGFPLSNTINFLVYLGNRGERISTLIARAKLCVFASVSAAMSFLKFLHHFR